MVLTMQKNKPTVKDISILLDKIKSNYEIDSLDEHKSLQKLIGVNGRTIRRWKAGLFDDPNKKSVISFCEWGKLKLLADNVCVFDFDININNIEMLNYVAADLICNSVDFKGCSAEQLMQFVGKSSFTGLSRSELCSIFKWDVKKFSADIANEKIRFTTVSMILLLCGVDKDKMFYLSE